MAQPGSELSRAHLELRYQVLRAPLGMDRSTVQFEREEDSLHLVAVRAGAVVGCVVMTPLGDGVVKLRQMAVDPALHRSGVGAALVRRLEADARSRGVRQVVMNARLTAVPFYAALGYAEEGPLFEEVGVPHRRMVKALALAPAP